VWRWRCRRGVEVITTFFAVTAAAATAAPLNPSYTTDEFRFYLEDIEAKALIVPPGGGEQARAAAPANAMILEAAVSADGQIQLTVVRSVNFPRQQTDPKPDDVALFLHTSGTTSRPKGVPLSHANLLASADNVASLRALTPEDVSLCVMPRCFVHGLVASTFATLRSGGTIVCSATFQRQRSGYHQHAHRATWYTAVPTIHKSCLHAQGDRRQRREPHVYQTLVQLFSLRSNDGGVEARFGCPVLEAYGRLGVSPDVIKSAAAGRTEGRLSWKRDRSASRHYGR
jgi:acyl-CoA synthetase (AMP-forming)/AMP-acid ligase II